MAYCPNGHGEQNGKFCDECGVQLVNRSPSGEGIRQRSSEATARTEATTHVNVNNQRDSPLVPLLVVLLVILGGAVAWLALNRSQPTPSSDPVAVAVAATLTAQSLPTQPPLPTLDSTATAAFATAQAVAQTTATGPVTSLPSETPNVEATVQAQVAAVLTTQATATEMPTPAATILPADTPDVEATVQAQVATALAAQPTVTETPVPSATPDTPATIAAGVSATQSALQTAQPPATATPNLDATVQAQVAAVLAAQPTATSTPVPSATPNAAATYEVAVLATLTAVARNQAIATATPNVNATLSAGIASTVTAVARSQPTATATPNLNATVSARVVATQTARPTATRNATATAAVATAQAVNRQPSTNATPQTGDTWTNPVDGATYVYVPAGELFMGTTVGRDDEQPVHSVRLDGFWIMRTEVTNAQYAACVKAKACPATIGQRAYDPAYQNHPIVTVSWNGASAYARWVGGQLPTEAQWEKTCRGTDQRTWPWGNNAPKDDLLNYGNFTRDTIVVYSYPSGTSPFGVLNMAGNVMEWTADWYANNYYGISPSDNPSGPKEGTMRVLRGGSFGNTSDGVTCTFRNRNLPTALVNTIGFRVVASRP